jgi:L-fuculose-phosphate aldolase
MEITFDSRKEEVMAASERAIVREFGGYEWTLRQKLAISCRILFDEGHASGLAGQITARGPKPGTYYTQRLGLGLDEVTASNLLLVDESLNVLQGEGIPNPANRFHSWVYRVRPDVNCIIHTHPPHTSALSMIGAKLQVSHMDSAALFDDCAFLEEWPGVPFGNEEGRIISEALGNKRSILLAHHGLLTAADRPEEACVLAIIFEKTAKLQLMAMAAGEIRPVDPDVARQAHDWELKKKVVDADFQYYARRALQRHGPTVA